MLEALTKQESKVYKLILKGKKRKEIERILVLSTGTINTYIQNIYDKLDVHSASDILYQRIQELERIIDELSRKTD